ncbi:MAG: copper chaperone PCu(A)C [Pseudomonadota bacterium]|nr:copper chaperone PCu(A)C [Pseudomonadota bacterium]
MTKQLSALIASIALASTAYAQTTVTEPWVRATVPQQSASGAFMQLRSADAARLVKVTSPAARAVEIHQMEMHGQLMKMREVDGIDLPAGRSVNLAAGGFHIMLVGLKQQLKEGDVVPITLVLERQGGKRESVTVNAPVKPLAYAASKGH